MPHAGIDGIVYQDVPPCPTQEVSGDATASSIGVAHDGLFPGAGLAGRFAGPRRSPRKSLIVVLPDNHVLSPELVAERLPSTSEQELVDVIVACAGQPMNLGVLQRKVRDLQVLLAPSGTSVEELRELAIMQAPGDIVTLLSGAPRQCDDA